MSHHFACIERLRLGTCTLCTVFCSVNATEISNPLLTIQSHPRVKKRQLCPPSLRTLAGASSIPRFCRHPIVETQRWDCLDLDLSLPMDMESGTSSRRMGSLCKFKIALAERNRPNKVIVARLRNIYKLGGFWTQFKDTCWMSRECWFNCTVLQTKDLPHSSIMPVYSETARLADLSMDTSARRM